MTLQKNKLEGYNYYLLSLLQTITYNNPVHTFLFVCDKAFDATITFNTNTTTKLVKPIGNNIVAIKFWYDVQLTLVAKKFKADVIVNLNGCCSLTTSKPQILAVPYLAGNEFNKFLPKAPLLFYKMYKKKFIQKATQIISNSLYNLQVIETAYSITNNTPTMVALAAQSNFVPLNSVEKESIKSDFAQNCAFFLFVGTIHPSGNLLQLLKAYSIFKKRQLSNTKLLLVGAMDWPTKNFAEKLATYKYRADVVVLNQVEPTMVTKIVAAAYALINTGLTDDYSLPILQAMQCGVPVACSNTSSMPAIVGNAALLFNPTNETDIAEQMMLLYKDETLRNSLIQKGYEQAAKFSWELATQKMWQLIEQTAN